MPEHNEAKAGPNDDLVIPHILDVMVEVGSAARELHGISLTIRGLLAARQNPLNIDMAEHMAQQLTHRLDALIGYIEVK